MATKTEVFSVVGIQFHLTQSARKVIGRKAPFNVVLQRDPENEYDANAIMVVIDDPRVSKEKRMMGHLRRQVAAYLAPLMDTQELKVESARVGWMDNTEAEVKVKFAVNKAKYSPLTE